MAHSGDDFLDMDYGDTRAKDSFWGPILDAGKTVLSGAGGRLKEVVTKRPREGGYSSTSEQVGAGLFDVLYERAKSGSKAATNKAAEKFRQTKFGKQFIDESTRLQIMSFFENPLYLIGAVVGALLLIMAVRK